MLRREIASKPESLMLRRTGPWGSSIVRQLVASYAISVVSIASIVVFDRPLHIDHIGLGMGAIWLGTARLVIQYDQPRSWPIPVKILGLAVFAAAVAATAILLQ